MHRRTIRLKREYLYRKSLEGKERSLYEKKRQIREALREGKPIPTELRNEEAQLRREIDLEDENTAVPRTHIDDEYAFAAEKDPKILLTTSRNPSRPLIEFVKELSFLFPNAEKMNRGSQVSRHELRDKKAIGTMPEAYPHIILENFNTKLGERTANILKHLFPVPKPDTKRIVTFANKSDYISFRHHIYEKQGGPKSVQLKEIGPRFELRLYQIKLGTVDQAEAQTEWVIRPYMNTTRKRSFLSN
ncbi:hypothetical protein TSUD_120850 [Trifolium subterraneum]|uniref:Brix domain-containing protein n=1 Tax=Trifolium subterraneum TaxID=3900 RepID=A0A2Z6MDE4_TRISU|nr:hypothetical protein TSUD_120850 [Trifolium subterraneum]